MLVPETLLLKSNTRHQIRDDISGVVWLNWTPGRTVDGWGRSEPFQTHEWTIPPDGHLCALWSLSWLLWMWTTLCWEWLGVFVLIHLLCWVMVSSGLTRLRFPSLLFQISNPPSLTRIQCPSLKVCPLSLRCRWTGECEAELWYSISTSGWN